MTDLRRVPGLPVHPHPEAAPDAALRVEGLVERPQMLSLDALRALPQRPFDADFVCLERWVAPDQHWRGVALSDVLELAGIRDEARWVQASSGEFSIPLALEDARRALLALELDGEPLPVAHGAPVRLVVPGGECFTSVKWLDRIDVRAEPAENSARTIALGRLERGRAGEQR
ncbi:MAG: molybdopterin-dependent oxidoreductase [Hyphomicrobiales bacterium]